MKRSKLYIAIDDTDELGYHTSTGEICEQIRKEVDLSYGSTTSVTRHQLLLHEDINYTSHNSSMCFTCEVYKEDAKEIQNLVRTTLLKESAPSSAASYGICFEDDLKDFKTIVEYGKRAKLEVLNEKIAYLVAKEQNIILEAIDKNKASGVIGALAGIALRLCGNDGRLRGRVLLDKKQILPSELLKNGEVDEIKTIDKSTAIEEKAIIFKDYLKWILQNNKRTLLVEDFGDFYKPLNKEALSRY